MNRKIDYHPYYQRNYVWDNAKATFFIESILLGTDVPPLIFFNSGSKIEVIDGRQRFETIKKFLSNELKLNINGLSKLQQLKNATFDKLDEDIQRLFLSTKIRVFEFEVFNEPRMNPILEDKVKKEIFRRYNSGITPLNSAEIDNAKYDDDEVTTILKDTISENEELIDIVRTKFLGRKVCDTSHVLQFLRRYLILSRFPINTYATGSNRREILELLYGVISSEYDVQKSLCDQLFVNLKTVLSLIDRLDIDNNKQINETLLWVVNILTEEQVSIDDLLSPSVVDRLKTHFNAHQSYYLDEKSHHYGSIINRFKATSNIFSELYKFNFSSYFKSDSFVEDISSLKQSEQEAILKLDELKTLRVRKPEPSVMPVEEILGELTTKNYQLRPSYQRLEQISVKKASAIIESIILGIHLPPLFIFTNDKGVNEVIDGQQRLLSIMGFLREKYLDREGNLQEPKLSGFKLQKLKILSNYNGCRLEDLPPTVQDKIYEFKLSVIEIDQSINENFEAVDLFIRLNNKPFPIKENSFEMWNSFADKEVIELIKKVTKENLDWFFFRRIKTVDRMLNEELITFLSYIHYNYTHRPDFTSVGYYERDGKINCRITNKKDISILFEKFSTDTILKNNFIDSINQTNEYLNILKSKLDKSDYHTSLNELLVRNGKTRYLVDFYVLFQIFHRLSSREVDSISYDSLKNKMTEIKQEINSPSSLDEGSQQQYFENLLDRVTQ
ncbi:TPA: DUF262 domain-containing protein [Vibrio vulnificus]